MESEADAQPEAEDPLVHSLPACAGYRRECLEAFLGDCDVVCPSGDGGKAVTAGLSSRRAARLIGLPVGDADRGSRDRRLARVGDAAARGAASCEQRQSSRAPDRTCLFWLIIFLPFASTEANIQLRH